MSKTLTSLVVGLALTMGAPAAIEGGGIASLNATSAARAPNATLARGVEPAPDLTVPSEQPSSVRVAPDVTRDELPAPATSLPMVALLGALALVGGALLLVRVRV